MQTNRQGDKDSDNASYASVPEVEKAKCGWHRLNVQARKVVDSKLLFL